MIARHGGCLVLFACCVFVATSAGCRSPDTPPRFELTLIGLHVEDPDRTLRFYEEKLGIQIFRRRTGGAMVSPGWTLPAVAEGRGLTVEVFTATEPAPTGRAFGAGQAMRPSIQVQALEEAVDRARDRGAPLTEDIRPGGIGRRAVVRTPEGIDWTIATARGLPAGDSMAEPHVGWIDIKTADLEGQVRFYAETFGLVAGPRGPATTLGQGDGLPFLVFHAGGNRRPRVPPPTLENSPVWLAFQTDDIETAYAWAESLDVTVTREVTLLPKIRLRYFVVEDVDGNPVQVFESAAPEWLRRIAYRYFLSWFMTEDE